MFKIIVHKPVYASGYDIDSVDFYSTDDVLEMDFVKCHAHQQGFYRYSLNRHSGSRVPLLAEYLEGTKWVVIGFIEGDVSLLNLPEWKNG